LSGFPEPGKLEIYTHTKADRSVVFLVNPNPFPKKGLFYLNDSIGLEGHGPYVIRELYPEERLLTGKYELHAQAGEQVDMEVSSRSVRVLEISRVPGYSNPPIQLAGLPASYDRFPDRYRIIVEGYQGERNDLYLFLPVTERISRVELTEKELKLWSYSEATKYQLISRRKKFRSTS
jgi:hypothetical protein